MKLWLQALVRKAGYDVVRWPPDERFTIDVPGNDRRIVEGVRPFTLTSVPRILSLVQAVRYVARGGIPGSIVECGVWRGGSMMAVARTLLDEGCSDRNLYLFDTFEGMTDPGVIDTTLDGTPAEDCVPPDAQGAWCEAGIDEVTANLHSTGYPVERLHFIQGRVEATIPQRAPDAPIALLRLDTDWYDSTRHELDHLFPRLAPRGVLIIDDYGHWKGSQKATDEFLARQPRPYLLHRIDYSGRLLINA